MTAAKLEREKEKAMTLAARRYEVALEIRAILEKARKEWPEGPKAWDDDGIEREVLDLVDEE